MPLAVIPLYITGFYMYFGHIDNHGSYAEFIATSFGRLLTLKMAIALGLLAHGRPVVDHPFPACLCDALMNALKNPAHRAWLILLIATGITWYLGEVGAAGTLAIVSMLLIAFVKGRLVILDFMELRAAPRLWRALLEGWLILVSSLILLAYWISLR